MARGDALARIETFGCRLNLAESETIARRLDAAGLDDVRVINTCAVTAEATRQARRAIRRAARERPEARLVVTGCAAQIEPDAFAAMPEVAHVVGTEEKLDPATWDRLAAPGAPRRLVSDVMAARAARAPDAAPPRGRTRAFVQVQTGCDHRCTFCVIPFGRGNARSVPAATVIETVRAQVAAGAREVVLTGVDLTSWGGDLDGGLRLGALVKALLAGVPDLARLRLSSIDSVEVDVDLLDAIATEPRLMPHLHLSLQAGDDLVLKRMKRRHARADAIRLCERLRTLRPGIALGADLIAGFPTETEAMFARSLDLVAECGLAHLHVFPYSPRPGTPAARMPQVPAEVARERARRLRQAGEAALARHLASHVGARRRVLAERGGTGRTEDFSLVRFAGAAPEPGALVEATIAATDGRALVAA
ncbi:tRNA (N(6)-L-threonylcarbamoyladenosine(37)-C(2))-methylthiotransferase MtaB [Salinarimonas rosea]|uniref:tRNA (N(6)-L-threonylcarbamoyladenosine(37)-C(2))- methylthiotransferase MtaB n=1 Tax=Salinarimonas rosea TaxID=552063 RepID=UPI000413C9D9|nr:tRNA (N(6)-L-threonylcarbamoyladenosine(37)-C(2))-methylthiotransferase MtaB [Salinarimonas rosea]